MFAFVLLCSLLDYRTSTVCQKPLLVSFRVLASLATPLGVPFLEPLRIVSRFTSLSS